jgi:hypothetical protein
MKFALSRITIADRLLTRVKVHSTIDRHRCILVRFHAQDESIAVHT